MIQYDNFEVSRFHQSLVRLTMDSPCLATLTDDERAKMLACTAPTPGEIVVTSSDAEGLVLAATT